MTPAQQQLVESAQRRLERDERIGALWLAGSLGQGKGDAYSDVDLLACCTEGTSQAVAQDIVADFATIAPPLLVMELFGGKVITTVCEGWGRLDINFTETEGMARHDPARLTELFNRTGIQPAGKTPETYSPTADVVLRLSKEFIRVLGLSPVAFGRGEWQLMMTGTELLRTITLDLMLEENGVAPWDRGGALKRRPLLTAQQLGELDGLPPLSPERESVLANQAALARIFLPRARRLAKATGAEWPEAFEQATLEHLKRELGLEIEANSSSAPMRPATP